MEKTEVPAELINKVYEAFSVAKDSGKVRKGTNEATKAIERGKALLVAIAQDVSPPEIVAHLPILCEEKNIPYVFVSKREELGKAAGLVVPTAAAAIVDAGEAKKTLADVIEKLKALSGKPAAKPEAKAEKPESPKPAAEKEKPKEEKKSEEPSKSSQTK